MTQLGCALTMDKFEAQKLVQEAVEKATNLAEAMECVGAMYGIPSSSILVDDDLKSVKIVNDTIMCPSTVSAAGNMNTIARSIAAVLDQISHRINHKMNLVQIKNIEQGKESDEVASRSDPSKGKVVATYKDSNGDILIVYDSGIIDAPQTPEGRKKADEIRERENIPAIDPLKKHRPSYFTDEDDLMDGVDQGINAPVEEYCISSIINEADYFIDAMAKYGDTSSLGQAVLTAHGYECVRPTMNVVQEAADELDKKSASTADVKFMKFDNSEIIKAIECLNKARKNQSEIKHATDLDVESFVRDKDYQEGIRHIENQFNCKLSIKWVHASKPESEAHTVIYPNEYRTKLTISKSKGFQLGGAPINIIIIEDGITNLISEKQELFGQAFTSVIIHEIFHNISGIMRYENSQFIASMTVALEEATATRDMKLRRIIIEKYVDTLNSQLDGKLGRASKRLIVKRFLSLVAAKSDGKIMTQVQDALDNDSKENNINREANNRVKRTINLYKASVKAAESPIKAAKTRGVVGLIVGGITVISGVLGAIFLKSSLGLVLSVALGLGGIGIVSVGVTGFASVNKYNKLMQKYKNTKNLEEYYADLLSGMYQLPQNFFIGGHLGNKKYTFNEVEQSTVDEWVKIEKIVYEHLREPHPSMSERSWTGVTIAKKLLECEHLDKSIRTYLQWIVDNNDKILKTDIKDTHKSSTFDPKEAEDLDKHLNKMISTNKLTVTESIVHDLVDSTEFKVWLENGCPYTEDELLYQERCQFINEFDTDLIQETKVFGYTDEKFLKRVFMTIPRIIEKCIESILHIGSTTFTNYIDAMYKMLTPDKMYTVDIDFKHVRMILEELETYIQSLTRYLNHAKDVNDYVDRLSNLKGIDNEIFYRFRKYADEDDRTLFYKTSNENLKGNKYTISGKQLADQIRDIHKIGDRLQPMLKELLAQVKRFNKSADIDSLTSEQKNNIKAITGLFKYGYLAYNNVASWIIRFHREKTSDKDIEYKLTGKKSKDDDKE